ncbi:hypothetical protein ANN_18418 [Periplaneta americana]|uniref:Uncharacterized protein n=1 Tax=Periplaneta americana TaxID=6978 RepID=A0ABQ8SPQ0_PERAM|nr:hypothetical protein ANN_18418 [Periplaneta americana]
MKHLLGRFSEELFSKHWRSDSRRKKNKVHKVADDMALLAEEEMIIKDMLLELNDSCEQCGMKTNENKTKFKIFQFPINNIDLSFEEVGKIQISWSNSNRFYIFAPCHTSANIQRFRTPHRFHYQRMQEQENLQYASAEPLFEASFGDGSKDR